MNMGLNNFRKWPTVLSTLQYIYTHTQEIINICLDEMLLQYALLFVLYRWNDALLLSCYVNKQGYC